MLSETIDKPNGLRMENDSFSINYTLPSGVEKTFSGLVVCRVVGSGVDTRPVRSLAGKSPSLPSIHSRDGHRSEIKCHFEII